MRRIPELLVFADHYDWYKTGEKGRIIATDKAPDYAVEAIKKFNARIEQNIGNLQDDE